MLSSEGRSVGTIAIKTTPGWLSCLRIDPAALGCNIKANISYNTGERIYHVPGQEYYWETRINLLKGERWFCSEEAARKAGWRKSRV
ncbi:hypothetical protein NKJ13_23325 [Mesorhizobium sp. M0174]|uniref:sunset domain-containing protein n=1 Tax=Mesorhizobium sp. M0174 TaxID=2956904 RepID=UPI00333AB517